MKMQETTRFLLEINNLSKLFGNFQALQDISLNIRTGEIFGLLGQNGAGKTTLIKSIFGLLKPSEGDILYKGKSLTTGDIHKNFGYLPENFLPPRELSAKEFLRFLSLSLKLPSGQVHSLLEEFELDGKKTIKNYSRGMIQRLGLAAALLKGPEFIILDEPTLGLDPVAQNKILCLLESLNNKGKTVFFSSHNLFHIEKICDRIAILHNGRIKFTGSVEGFIKKNKSDSLEQAFLAEEAADV